MVQILALEINFRAAEILCHLLRVIKQRWTSRVFAVEFIKLRNKIGVFGEMLIRVLQLVNFIHQRFGDILSAKFAVSSFAHFKLLSLGHNRQIYTERELFFL